MKIASRDPRSPFSSEVSLRNCLTQGYSRHDAKRPILMPVLIVVVILALGIFYLVSPPVVKPTLRAVPVSGADTETTNTVAISE